MFPLMDYCVFVIKLPHPGCSCGWSHKSGHAPASLLAPPTKQVLFFVVVFVFWCHIRSAFRSNTGIAKKKNKIKPLFVKSRSQFIKLQRSHDLQGPIESAVASSNETVWAGSSQLSAAICWQKQRLWVKQPRSLSAGVSGGTFLIKILFSKLFPHIFVPDQNFFLNLIKNVKL